MSLMSTMKTLRLRRNVIKLTLYRRFANIVVFMVVGTSESSSTFIETKLIFLDKIRMKKNKTIYQERCGR